MRIPLPDRASDGSYSTMLAGMMIDGDGANGQSSLPVYAPAGMAALDYLRNAGGPGDWYGIVTHNGLGSGKPVVQGKDHPAPGAFVSATSYEFPDFSRGDPRRYVDSAAVIYIVLPGHWRKEARGIVLGCRATVTDVRASTFVEAVVADFGPRGKLGEASIACAKAFQVPSSPKSGGTEEKRFRYQFWPGVAAEGFELQGMR